jgi:hypothetical protein
MSCEKTLRPPCIGHSFPIEDEGIMTNMGKGIEIENSHFFNYHLETIKVY